MPVTQVVEINEISLKTLTPLSSVNEQAVVLDEYGIHLAQFSIAINRVLGAGISDENMVALLKLLAGMYTLPKTSLLGPKQYFQLLNGIEAIEEDARLFISHWAQTKPISVQEEALAAASFCNSAVQRAYFTLMIMSCCPELQEKNISLAVNCCKGVLHPLKGLFLQRKLLSVLQNIPSAQYNADYFIESYSFSLKLFSRWTQMGLRSERQQRVSEREELFELAFCPLLRSINQVSTAETFSKLFLPTILSELINTVDAQTQTLVFDSLCSLFRMELIIDNLGAILKATGQFTVDFNIRERLEGLFSQVISHANFAAHDASFFSLIWQEVQQLIKNRCEIDLKDAVSISTALLSLAFQIIPTVGLAKPINEVLAFLAKILLSNRDQVFQPTSPVGSALVELLEFVQSKATDLSLFLELSGREGFPLLSRRLAPSALRKSLLALVSWMRRDHLQETPFYSLFACFFQSDLMAMLDSVEDGIQEQFQSIAEDLTSVTESLVNLSLSEADCELLSANVQSGSLISLFLFPRLIETASFACRRKLLSALLACTATTMPPSLYAEAEPFDWLHAEYPKTLAARLNLHCAQHCTNPTEAYEFYSEVLAILNSGISSDSVKMEIISELLPVLSQAKELSQADLSCLIDHLIMNANQLLRKRDRCQLLLAILESFPATTRLYENIAIALEGLTEREERIEFSLRLLELEPAASLQRVFKWLCLQSDLDPVRFYSIKLRYETAEKEETEEETEEEVVEEVVEDSGDIIQETEKDEPVNSNSQFTELDQTISEDLKKLSVFESIPDSFNF